MTGQKGEPGEKGKKKSATIIITYHSDNYHLIIIMCMRRVVRAYGHLSKSEGNAVLHEIIITH